MKIKNLCLISIFFVTGMAFAKGSSKCDEGNQCEVKKNSQGQEDGEEKCFDHKKKLRRQAFYQNGKFHGLWKCFDEKGTLTASVEYKSGEKNGIEKNWIEALNKYDECQYEKNKKSGPCKVHNYDMYQGKPEFSGYNITQYKDNNKHGWLVSYDKDGKEAKRICFQNDRIETENKALCGALAASVILPQAKLKNNGLIEKKNKDGKIESIESWKNDQLDGVSKYFFENGKLEREVTYKKSVPYGLETRYFDNGKIKEKILWQGESNVEKAEGFFMNGQPDYTYERFKKGQNREMDLYEYKGFFDTGKLKVQGRCWVSALSFNSNCEIDEGNWKHFNEDGSVKLEENFTKGKKHGEFKKFFADTIEVEAYKDDIKLSKIIIDRKNNKIIKNEKFHPDGSIILKE